MKGKKMPRFNLEDYETVEERIKRFYSDHPDGRIISYELTSEEDRARKMWVVRAQVFTNHEDQHANCPKASGFAFEIEGTAGANQTSSLENAETSAIGRALANAGYSGNKRASREEMAKVERGAPVEESKKVPDDFIVKVDAAVSVDELTNLWEDAMKNGWSKELQPLFASRKKAVS
jgi:hypothetical protein